MGFERDSDYDGIEKLPILAKHTLAAGEGVVFGVADSSDPASVWTQIQPGATDTSSTGCCFTSFLIKNTGATNPLTWAFTQPDAKGGSPESNSLAKGESDGYDGGDPVEVAKLAVYSELGTTFELRGVLNRRPNYRDAGVVAPEGHPGHGSDVLADDLTWDIDWLTFDSTVHTFDATEY